MENNLISLHQILIKAWLGGLKGVETEARVVEALKLCCQLTESSAE
jgi:hypothetical protein